MYTFYQQQFYKRSIFLWVILFIQSTLLYAQLLPAWDMPPYLTYIIGAPNKTTNVKENTAFIINNNKATCTNRTLVIQGTLLADVNLHIENCSLYFCPGAKLIIQQGARIHNSILTSCDGRPWTGITVTGGFLTIMDSRISDASTAISINNPTINGGSFTFGLVLARNTFSDNGEGLIVGSNGTITGEIYENLFTNTQMGGTGITLNPCGGFSSFIIECNRFFQQFTGLIIGEESISILRNSFSNCFTGIINNVNGLTIGTMQYPSDNRWVNTQNRVLGIQFVYFYRFTNDNVFRSYGTEEMATPNEPYQQCLWSPGNGFRKEEAEYSRINKETKVSIYPNPTKGDLVIEYYFETERPNMLEIYSPKGEVCLRKALPTTSDKLLIDTRDWAEGLYLIQIRSANQVIAKEKVIILK